jgi:hypothetical protein
MTGAAAKQHRRVQTFMKRGSTAFGCFAAPSFFGDKIKIRQEGRLQFADWIISYQIVLMG